MKGVRGGIEGKNYVQVFVDISRRSLAEVHSLHLEAFAVFPVLSPQENILSMIEYKHCSNKTTHHPAGKIGEDRHRDTDREKDTDTDTQRERGREREGGREREKRRERE